MHDYFKIPTSIIIPGNCRRIGPWAFCCTGLKDVVILDGCEKIGEAAFKDCYNLEKVEIPESVVEIRDFAFRGCEKLKRVVADGLLILKNYAFWGCRGLADLIIPVNVKSEDYAFSGCEKAEIKYRVRYKC